MGEIRYYEDVAIGEEFRSRTRTITETDVVSFASLSDDWSEVHISDEFAKGTASVAASPTASWVWRSPRA